MLNATHKPKKTVLFLLLLLVAAFIAPASLRANVSGGANPAVMTATKVYLIYWQWVPDYSRTDAPAGFEDLGNSKPKIESLFNSGTFSPWFGVASQYWGNIRETNTGFTYPATTRSVAMGGSPPYADSLSLYDGMIAGIWTDTVNPMAWVPTDLKYPDDCPGYNCKSISLASAQDEIRRAWTHFGSVNDGTALYVLLLPQHVYPAVSGDPHPNAPWCTDHTGCTFNLYSDCKDVPGKARCSFADGDHQFIDNPTQGAGITWAAVKYSTNQSTAYHEAVEAMTDPVAYLNMADYSATLYGYHANPSGEVMDLCQDWDAVPIQSQKSTFADSRGNYSTINIRATWSNRSNRGSGACVYRYTTHRERYYVNSTGSLCHDTLDGSPTCWWLGAALSQQTEVGAVQWGYNRADVFALTAGSPAAVQHAWTNDGGSTLAWEAPWAPPPGYSFDQGVSVASWGFYHLDVYVTGNQTLFHKGWDASTLWTPTSGSGWDFISTPGFTINSAVAATSWGPNRVDLYLIDGSGQLRQGGSGNAVNFSWQVWPTAAPLPAGVSLIGFPDVASWGYQRLDVVALGSDGGIYHTGWSYNSAATGLYGWEYWGYGGGLHGSSPRIVALGDDRLHIEMRDFWGYTYQWDWDSGPGTWSWVSGVPNGALTRPISW